MKYDVVVVGAGPAGSTAAKCLAEKGIKVLLLDKQTFPRDKPCGGGLPTRVVKRFPYIEDLIDSISYGSKTYSSSLKYTFTVQRDEPLIAMVLRKDFDHGLVKYAQEKGAVFQSEKTVVDVRVRKDNVLVTLDNGKTVEAQVVIGCDGMKGIVAEKGGLHQRNSGKCLCVIQEQPMSKKQLDAYFSEKRLVHLFIKTQGIAGYGWVFPKKNHINIGIGEFESAGYATKPKKNLREIYEQYIMMLKENKILPGDFVIENLNGGVLPVFPREKTYADRILLCGDAAGFINPITGEGIYYAITSGEIAATVVADALREGDPGEQFLSRYQVLWKQEFGRDLELLGRFNKQWGQSTEKMVRLFTKDATLAKLVIGITGGQISFSKYKTIVVLRYLYASIKDMLGKK